MNLELLNFLLGVLTLILLYYYTKYTSRIARDNSLAVSSVFIKQRDKDHLDIFMKNFSKIEVESYIKLIAITDKGVFEFKEGPYGDDLPWIAEPFAELHGHFKLGQMVNDKNEELRNYLKEGELNKIELIINRKYKNIRHKDGWIIPKPQRWIYTPNKNLFWLDIGFNPK